MLPFFITLYRLVRSFISAFRDPEFRALFFLVAIILASGTLFYHGVEGFGWLDALYFSVTTLATVGYGDLSPHTDLGKVFTIIYILVGIGVLFGFIDVIAEHARNPHTPSFRGFFRKSEKDETPAR
jgi:voltage-gated potassium channel Kch